MTTNSRPWITGEGNAPKSAKRDRASRYIVVSAAYSVRAYIGSLGTVCTAVIRKRHEHVVGRARGKGMRHLTRSRSGVADPGRDSVNGTFMRY